MDGLDGGKIINWLTCGFYMSWNGVNWTWRKNWKRKSSGSRWRNIAKILNTCAHQ